MAELERDRHRGIGRGLWRKRQKEAEWLLLLWDRNHKFFGRTNVKGLEECRRVRRSVGKGKWNRANSAHSSAFHSMFCLRAMLPCVWKVNSANLPFLSFYFLCICICIYICICACCSVSVWNEAFYSALLCDRFVCLSNCCCKDCSVLVFRFSFF